MAKKIWTTGQKLWTLQATMIYNVYLPHYSIVYGSRVIIYPDRVHVTTYVLSSMLN